MPDKPTEQEAAEAPANGWDLRHRIRTLRKKKLVHDWIEPLSIAVLIALIFRHFLFEPYKIPSGSMRPTLMDEPHYDRILVKKFAYGIRLPFGTKYYFPNDGPQRWDVVVFRSPKEPKTLVKRVVGLPGELVQIKDGAVHINGKRLDGPPSLPGNYYYSGPEMGQMAAQGKRRQLSHGNSLISERMLKEVAFVRIATKNNYSTYGTEPTLIPDGHIFVLGDNSANSKDGRQWGFAPIGTVKGKAILIWYPISRWQMLGP